MTEEPVDEPQKEADFVDIMYGKLGIGEVTVSLIFNSFIREEILLALMRGGLLTKEQIEATLDRAEKEIDESCDNVVSKWKGEENAAEVIQRMKKQAKFISEGIRKRIIESSPQSPEQE